MFCKLQIYIGSLFLFYSVSTMASDLCVDIHHLMSVPGPTKNLLYIGSVNFEDELEYDIGPEVKDERTILESKARLGFARRFYKDFIVGIEIDYLFTRETDRVYGPTHRLWNTGKHSWESTSGLGDPTFSIVKILGVNTRDRYTILRQVMIGVTPETGKAYIGGEGGRGNGKNGGSDFVLGYRFGFRRSGFEFSGMIYSKYYGRKVREKRGSTGRVIEESRTGFGMQFDGFYFLGNHFVLRPMVEFILFSNYGFHDGDETVQANKGFRYGAALAIDYFINDEYRLTLSSKRYSEVYNLEYSPGERPYDDVDYEFEYVDVQLMMAVVF
jgi:hypothetical protein